jgi:hypothetical protein
MFNATALIKNASEGDRTALVDALIDEYGLTEFLIMVAKVASERPECERKIQMRMNIFVRTQVRDGIWRE